MEDLLKDKKALPKLKKNLNNVLKKIETLESRNKIDLSDNELENLFQLRDEKNKLEKK